MEMTKIDYKNILNDYYHKGKSKDWLYGYIQCLHDNKFVDSKEGMILHILIEQCKPSAGSKYIKERR